MVEQLKGKWVLVSSENFDDYMKEVGVSWATRQIGSRAKPNVIIDVNGNKVTIDTESVFKNTHLEFTLGEEFDETTPDGRQVKSIFVFEDGKLVCTQKGKVDSTISRYLEGEEMVTVCVANSVTSTRKYKRSE